MQFNSIQYNLKKIKAFLCNSKHFFLKKNNAIKIKFHEIQLKSMQFDAILYETIQFYAAPCNSKQFDAIQYNSKNSITSE